jgi:hypothetical protein
VFVFVFPINPNGQDSGFVYLHMSCV